MLARSGFSSSSHSGKDLLQILETYPRDELFQIGSDDLAATALSVMHLQERRQLRLFLRRDAYGRFMSCMVYLPRDRYTTQVRHAMEAILLEAFDGVSIDYTALVSESVLARLHFVVRVDPDRGLPDVDPAQVEAELVRATRSWDDDFADALRDSCGAGEAARLAGVYGDAFPEAYKEDLPGRRRGRRPAPAGAADQRRRHRPEALPAARTPSRATGGSSCTTSASRSRCPRCCRALQDMGVEVVDERPYEIDRPGRPSAWVYDFGLRYEPSGELPGDDARTLFEDAFAAVWAGEAESDGFNALVLRAGLTWRQAMVLRAYAKYLRQGGNTFSQRYIEECLHLQHPPRATAGRRCSRRGSTRRATRPAGSAPRSWSTG